MSLRSKIESLLFISTRPMTIRKIAETVGASEADVESAIADLSQTMNVETSGIQLLRHGQTIEFVTNPVHSKMITEVLKEEQAGELSRPSLETLTIIAYRGPISKIQLDTIRGVNCSLILRNLMIKGLVEAKANKNKLQTMYQVTMDFIRFLGVHHISELPDYELLNRDETLEQLLNPTAVHLTEDGQPAEATSSPDHAA